MSNASSNTKDRDTLAETFIVEEYIQMHEHLRQREGAMTTLLNLMMTAVTTLTAALGAYVFQIITATPAKLTLWHCYLLLIPTPIIIFSMAMLTAHRDDVFKMGYYLVVFFEEQYGGAAWGTRLAHLRHMGESQDSAAFIAWALLGGSAALFSISICMICTLEGKNSPNLLILAPLFFVMLRHTTQFLRNRDIIKVAWEEVRKNEKHMPD